MKRCGFEVVFGLGLLAGCVIFNRWQNPGSRRKLSHEEIERYLTAAQTLRVPPDAKAQFLARLRAWMEADDGRPFYNLNLMRYYPQLRRAPGDPDFAGTPEASNAHYESTIVPKLLKIGGFPTFAADVHEPNLYGYGAGLDNWDRIVIARYPSRRAFMNLLADPSYQSVEPYKAMALDQLVLIPASGKLALPDATWLVAGAGVIAFLALGWARAARQR